MTDLNKLPDFIVIGAMKCGTTSLWQYLQHHPEIFLPKGIKNIEYFDGKGNWNKGLDFYRSHFTNDKHFKCIGEISTEYTKYPHVINVAKNLHSILPNIKLIYLIRHPIERLISHYVHNIGSARESRDINEALSQRENNSYIIYSQYYLQVSQFLQYFNKDMILFVTSEQLKNNRQAALNRIFDFIGVDNNIDAYPEVTAHRSDSKKRWNWLGKRVRTNPKYFNQYNYYLSRLPTNVRAVTERCFCQSIKYPRINQDNHKYISDVFINDLSLLKQHTGFHNSDWTFATGTNQAHA